MIIIGRLISGPVPNMIRRGVNQPSAQSLSSGQAQPPRRAARGFAVVGVRLQTHTHGMADAVANFHIIRLIKRCQHRRIALA